VFENSLKREISNETAAISRWNPIFKHAMVNDGQQTIQMWIVWQNDVTSKGMLV
jgi:hypothetical protein